MGNGGKSGKRYAGIVTSYELQVTSYELRVTGYELRVTGYETLFTPYLNNKTTSVGLKARNQ